MELWIARDKSQKLFLFKTRPYKDSFAFGSDENCEEISERLFPEVTWENSPRKIRFELI